MYAGRVVETGTVEEVLLHPRHPYTKGLLESIPSRGTKGKPLAVIKGVVPNPLRMPPGCKFQPRCPYAFDQCVEEPELIHVNEGRTTRCWLQDPANADRLDAYLAEPHYGASVDADRAAAWRAAAGGRRMTMSTPEAASEAPAVASDGADASLLEIRNLKTYFPIRSGILRGVVGQVKAVDDVSFDDPPGRGLRAGRGVGLRQDDARPDDPAARDATAGSAFFDGKDVLARRGRRPQAAPSPDAGDLPGPDEQPQPEDARQRPDRARACSPRRTTRTAGGSAASATSASATSSRPSSSGATTPAGIPTSSRAGSDSGSASPGRSPCRRSSSSRTSPSRPSTSRSSRRS